MPRVVQVHAPAKLNLALSVGPCDASGMHPICSWMATVDLHDDLQLTRLEPDRFSRYAILWHESARRRDDIAWSITKDCAVRAHLALERHLGRTLPVQLKLEKRIPLAAGLGGGSADAAAMLHGLNLLYELGLDDAELAEVGATVGSDVPFLVHGGSALVEGVGSVTDVHGGAVALHAVLVLPAAGCPTAEVYRAFDAIGRPDFRPDAVRALAGAHPAAPAPGAPFNDLAAAACRVAPVLIDHLAALSRLAERPAHVTGSGSTLFVLCDDALHAEYLARAIETALDLPALPVAGTMRTPAALAEVHA